MCEPVSGERWRRLQACFLALPVLLVGCVGGGDGVSPAAAAAGGVSEPAVETSNATTPVAALESTPPSIALRDCTVQIAGVWDTPPGPSPIGYPDGWNPAADHAYGLILLGCEGVGVAQFEPPALLLFEVVGSGTPPPECERGTATPYLLSSVWTDDAEIAQELADRGLKARVEPMSHESDGLRHAWTWGVGNRMDFTSAVSPLTSSHYAFVAFWWNVTSISNLAVALDYPRGENYSPPAGVLSLSDEMLYERAADVSFGSFLGSGATGELLARPEGGYECA